MSEELQGKAFVAFFATLGLALALGAVLGIGSCIDYSRQRERACLRQGGQWMYAAGSNACVRVQLQTIPAQVVP